MQSDVINPLQNTSYTSKDFNAVYTELLDLVKQLTYRWDPSISNESDPGVILLKLNAIIADKCNYNIDKNVLECFPLSVTQDINARHLFEQMGYYMHWYKGAVTDISMRYTGTSESTSYVTIPAFTMVTDYSSSVVYTLIGPSGVTSDDTFNVGNSILNLDGSSLTFKAIQGIAVDYAINNETLITASHLDDNNRIYFASNDVAQNGIFITNYSDTGTTNYDAWVRKDNLLAEATGNTFYKFGIADDGTSCYLEFPSDAEILFGQGINITYIRTLGEAGNVTAKFVEKFYNDTTLVKYPDETDITLSMDNVSISNASAAINGCNPQTINNAYKQYKRTVGTFDTLVTLRDYINYILNTGLVSNGFVCDRTNDLQCAYQIITSDGDVNSKITQYSSDNDLTAFSLKLYLLQYIASTTTAANFNASFDMLNNSSQSVVKAYISDIKSISHDYADLKTVSSTDSHFCYFKNKYPVVCTVTCTQQNLTDAQKYEIEYNIQQALFENLNSSSVEFSQEITIDSLLTIISNADERIKNVSLGDIEYTTYAVYYTGGDNGQFVDVPVSDNSDWSETTTTFTYSCNEFSSANVYYKDDTCIYQGDRYKCIVTQTTVDTIFIPSQWELYNLTTTVDYETFVTKIGDRNYASYKFIYAGSNMQPAWLLNGKEVSLQNFGLEISGTPVKDNTFTLTYSVSATEDHSFTDPSGLQPDVVDQAAFRLAINAVPQEGKELVFTYGEVNKGDSWTLNGTVVDLSDYGIVVSGQPEMFLSTPDYFVVNVSLSKRFRDEIYAKCVLAGCTQFLQQDETFDYKLNQKFKSVIKNIESVTTNVNITVTPESASTGYGEYKLRNNECIQLYAPNVISGNSYSNYVKMEWYIKNKISENELYRLSDDEYFVFYWKDEDDTDSVYNYAAYGLNTIVCPSVSIDKLTDYTPKGQSIITELKASTPITDPVTGIQSKYIDYISNGAMTTEVSDAITGLYGKFVLSGSKSVTIKKLNQLVLDSAYSCYWILNDVVDNQYVLFDTPETYKANVAYSFGTYLSHTEDGVTSTYITLVNITATQNTDWDTVIANKWVTAQDQTRVLNSGEYFIYTDSNMSTLNILGTGTELSRSGSTSKWYVDKIDSSAIFVKGLSAITEEGVWKHIPSDAKLKVVENQYININSGCTLRLDKQGTWSQTFTSEPKTLSSSDYVIKYKELGDENYTTVTSVNLEPLISGWKVRSLLSLDMSATTKQRFLSGQSLTCKIAGDSNSVVINGQDYDVTEQSYPQTCLASTDVVCEGGSNISTYTTDLYGNRSYLSIYQFEDKDTNTDFNDDGIAYSSDGSVNMEFLAERLKIDSITCSYTGAQVTCSNNYKLATKLGTNGSHTFTYHAGTDSYWSYKSNRIKLSDYYLTISPESVSDGTTIVVVRSSSSDRSHEFKFSIDNGEYVIPLRSTASTTYMYVKLDNNYVYPISMGLDVTSTTPYNYNSSKMYYLHILLNDSTPGTEHTISVQISDHSEDITINFKNPFKFNYPLNMDRWTTDQMIKLIKSFDTNDKFDYCYVVDSVINISNPLVGKSFLDINHIYYPYTICQLDCYNSSCTINN